MIPETKPNIYIFLIESYGASSIQTSPLIRSSLRQLSHELKNNYHMQSGFLKSPVFGGQSWLSFASMNCGVMLHNELAFKALFRHQSRCLASVLKKWGYRSITVRPGTKFGLLKEEKATFAFDFDFIGNNLGYKGKPVGWSGIPDEFSALVLNEKLNHQPFNNHPHLVQFTFTASHTPWQESLPFLGLNLEDRWQSGKSSASSPEKKRTLGLATIAT